MSATLASALAVFCAQLRDEHDFAIGRASAYDALRAADLAGMTQRSRFKAMLRAICCSKPAEIAVFDRAFEAYFDDEGGTPQPKHPRKHRPEGSDGRPQERNASFRLHDESLAETWMALQARYSPHESAGAPPPVPREGYEAADALVRRIIARLPLGRSRRLRAAIRGRRIDLRATVRSSLQTGGEILRLRRREPPLRNPRFVILIDASRSMSEHAGTALQVAHALCRRTRRASAFAFSTSLREITRELRAIRVHDERALAGIGEAWGGGTRIGASLRTFTRNFAGRFDGHTYVIIVSDGLDVGDVGELRSAIRTIARRSAGVAWVNPHAAEPGYEPSAAGMLAVLPYLTSLTAWKGLADA
jgi:uncharacterized protein